MLLYEDQREHRLAFLAALKAKARSPPNSLSSQPHKLDTGQYSVSMINFGCSYTHWINCTTPLNQVATMRPIKFNQIGELLAMKTLLLLDVGQLNSNLLDEVSPRGLEVLTSKEGKRLPGELWNAVSDILDESVLEDGFCFVQVLASEHNTQDNSRTLQLQKVDILNGLSKDGDKFLAGSLTDVIGATNLHEFIQHPRRFSLKYSERDLSQPDQLPKLHVYPPTPENTFHLTIRMASSPSVNGMVTPYRSAPSTSPPPPCLFQDVEACDMIAWLEDGWCEECCAARTICLGCYDVGSRWDMSMSCGSDLMCPLCMGLTFAFRHFVFLQWVDDGGDVTQEDEDTWNQDFEERKAELEYYD